jgi:toxin CptA
MIPAGPWPQGAALRLRLAPSRQLAWLLGLGHAGAVLLSWITPLKWWLSLPLSLAALASLRYGLRYHALRSAPDALVGLELRPDGSAAVRDRSGRWTQAQVLGSSFVSPGLTILNLRLAKAHCSLVVAPDSLDADDFRRLRVWLRWRGAPQDAPGGR